MLVTLDGLFGAVSPQSVRRLADTLASRGGILRTADGRVVAFIHRYRVGRINSVRGFTWFTLGRTLRSAGMPSVFSASARWKTSNRLVCSVTS